MNYAIIEVRSLWLCLSKPLIQIHLSRPIIEVRAFCYLRIMPSRSSDIRGFEPSMPSLLIQIPHPHRPFACLLTGSEPPHVFRQPNRAVLGGRQCLRLPLVGPALPRQLLHVRGRRRGLGFSSEHRSEGKRGIGTNDASV